MIEKHTTKEFPTILIVKISQREECQEASFSCSHITMSIVGNSFVCLFINWCDNRVKSSEYRLPSISWLIRKIKKPANEGWFFKREESMKKSIKNKLLFLMVLWYRKFVNSLWEKNEENLTKKKQLSVMWGISWFWRVFDIIIWACKKIEYSENYK